MAQRRSKVQTTSPLIPVLALLVVLYLLYGGGSAGVVFIALEIGIIVYAIVAGNDTLVLLVACFLIFTLASRFAFNLTGRSTSQTTQSPAKVKQTVASEVAQLYLALAERRCPEQLSPAAEAQVVQAFLGSDEPSPAACKQAVARVGPAGFGLRGESQEDAVARIELSSGGRARYTAANGVVLEWLCDERRGSCVVSGFEGAPFPKT